MCQYKLLLSDFYVRFSKYFLIIILFLHITSWSYSQSKQGSYWYFGERAGVLFNLSGSVTAQTNGATTGTANLEGTATISDTSGNLLFYTDGQTVWNKNHSVMTNGTGLMGHPSSTQSGVIVPHPVSTDTFYLFTIDAAHNNLANGLRYSIVKMSLSSGLGAVTSTKNVLLSPSGVLMAEKITAVKHCNNRDIWVICHGYGSTNGNKFYAYLITPSGVSTTAVISTVGSTHNGGDVSGYGNSRGYMKASADGKKIALAIPYDGCPTNGNINTWTQGTVEVFDLSTRTGQVTNSIKFTKAAYKGSYGIEFSPGGSRLYASQWGSYTDPSTVWQWNLLAGSATAVQNSATLIATTSPAPGALQLALNGKIYIVKDYGATFPRNGYMDAISYPNNQPSTCGYTNNAVSLGTNRYGRYGLPTFISSYFNPGYNVSPSFVATPTSFTIDDTTQIDSVYWSFGDPASGANNHSRLYSPTHTYQDTGNYQIQLIIYKCGIADTLSSSLPVYPLPEAAFSVNDTDQCLNGNSFSFTNQSTIIAGSMTYLWKFGDNTTSTQKNPTKVYTTAGNRTVWLICTSDAGGKDSVSRKVYVRPKPAAAYSVNDSTQCQKGNEFKFTNSSSISSGTLTYIWRFGDASTSTTTSPSHSYTTPNTFSVTLVAVSDYGCKDSITSRHSIVYPMPSPKFTISDSTQCFRSNSFTFTNTSTISSGTMTYNWAFGDGGTSTATSPTHTYASVNTFQVKLMATSDKGCIDSIKKNTYSYPMPVPSFSINDSTQCIRGNNFVFTNSSTVSSGTLTYLWRFGDGGTSSATNPSHSYATVNNYNVNMVAISNHGCRDSVTKKVYLYAMPVAKFIVNDSTQCITGNSFVFTNQSTSATSYKWYFGDGTTSVLTNPSKTYSTDNTYTVKLVVTSVDGCNDSTTRKMYVYPKPTPKFTINDNTQCLRGNNFVFTNTSTINSGSMTYKWTFGDGQSAVTTNTSHVYTTSGSYSVKLVATSNQACKDSISETATVYPMPVTAFSINDSTQCLRGNSFVFTNGSSISSGSITYLWNFGDGLTSASASPTHVYTTVGTFKVKLVTTSGFACKDSIIKTVYVYPNGTTNFTINNDKQCLSGNSFVFTNTSSISSGTLTYKWTFGDGGTSTQTNTSHSYASANTYNVKLVSTSNQGCPDSITKQVTVYPQPKAGFTINDTTQCTQGNNFVFNNTSTIGSGSITYKWNFGDGQTSTATSPSHSYTNPGIYNVKLVTTSGFGCGDSITKKVYVYASPKIGYTVNDTTQCLRGNNFIFTNSSTISSGTITYLWTFGDGGTATARNTSHVYTTANNFNVKLVITSNMGCKDSLTRRMTVYAQPVANFSVNDSTQCLKGNNFVFTNSSTISSGTMNYNWTFGDATSSTLISPSKSYATTGTFNVKLVSNSNNGCRDSVTKRAFVYHDPVAKFNINDTTQCQRGNNYIFTNTSTIGSGTFTSFWNFGDGGTASTQNTTHVYANDGTYNVKLLITSNFGCKDSTIKKNYVYPMPDAEFVNYDSAQCLERNSFYFINQSAINSGSMTYLWKFGDGFTSTVINPSHSYISAGSYLVTLRATSNLGCIDSSSMITFLHIHPEPIATYSVNDSNQCFKANNFVFTNSSTIASGTFTPEWNFGDGSSSGSFSASHSFLTSDTFLVKLLVISDWGCKDSILKKMYVYPMPQVSFAIKDTIQCLKNNLFGFQNTTTISSGAITYLWDFGDGNSSVDTSPVHIYANPGIYEVKLTVTSGLGCSESASKKVYVYPPPVAGFTFLSDSSQCFQGNSFSLNNTTSIPAGSYTSFWDFGDGSTSIVKNPVHSYITSDTFLIKLVVTSSYGCSDSVSRQVEVNVMPVADFSINDSVQCFDGNNFIFTNTSVLTSGNFYLKWHFGDGDSSAYLTPAHVYNKVDSFQVVLIIRSQNGCKDTVIKRADVRPMPLAGFTVNDSDQCFLGNLFEFTNTSSISSGQLFGEWDFGDAAYSNLLNPKHSYSVNNSFIVRMVIMSAYGCSDTMFKKVYVQPSPQLMFTTNDSAQCFRDNSFAFTNSSRISNGTLTYTWDLGDGTSSNQINPTHSYLSIDTFNVKLIAESQIGCSDTLSKNMYVFNNPTSNFLINDTAQCLKGNSFSFSNIALPGEGNFQTFWQFGDGDTSYNKTPVHTYVTADSFMVRLVLKSDLGCTDSIVKKVFVHPMPLTSFVINDSSQCLNLNSYEFTNTTTIKTGSLTYSWDFGDASGSVIKNEIHSYALPDTYAVKLMAVSQLGCYDSAIRNVFVRPDPAAGFTLNDTVQCFKNNLFSFTNTSLISSGNLMYDWDFGDGGTSISRDPIHSYNTIDSFKVQLITSSDFGCSDTFEKMVYVKTTPVADFNINNAYQYLPYNKFIFTNTSVSGSGAISYFWDFGDGSTSILQDPDHVYASADTFEVMLIVGYGTGCTDTIKKFVYIISATIIADFTALNVCKGDTVFFENTSQIQNDTFKMFVWDFGDNSAAIIDDNPYHIYNDTGLYNVTMIAISQNGFKDTVIHSIYLLPRPLVDITYDKDTVIYQGQSVVLTANGVFDKVLWSTGDQTASIIVNNQGLFSVVVTGSNGCKSYDEINVIVLEKKRFSFMTVITPNGDGINDLWKVFDIEQYAPCKLVICNRWGDEIFSINDYKNDWDGIYKGKILPEGTYYFYLESYDHVIYKGAINLVE